MAGYNIVTLVGWWEVHCRNQQNDVPAVHRSPDDGNQIHRNTPTGVGHSSSCDQPQARNPWTANRSSEGDAAAEAACTYSMAEPVRDRVAACRFSRVVSRILVRSAKRQRFRGVSVRNSRSKTLSS